MNLFLTVPTDYEIGAILAVFGLVSAIGILFALLVYFISALGYMKMFQKAGLAGWKAFVPVYNDYLCAKISWNTKIFWIALVLLAAFQLLAPFENTLVGLLAIVFGIAYIVVAILRNIKMAKAFGKGVGTGILLCLFPFIVSLVLGFGKAEYVGPQK